MQKYVIRVARMCVSECVRARGYGKASGNPIRATAPGGGERAHGERGKRPTNQGPNIGCQEFSYLDAAPGKSQAFPRKFFCRHDEIDTRYRLGSGVKARTIRRIQEAARNISDAMRYSVFP